MNLVCSTQRFNQGLGYAANTSTRMWFIIFHFYTKFPNAIIQGCNQHPLHTFAWSESVTFPCFYYNQRLWNISYLFTHLSARRHAFFDFFIQALICDALAFSDTAFNSSKVAKRVIALAYNAWDYGVATGCLGIYLLSFPSSKLSLS